VAGNVKVGNRRGLLGIWQHIEYVIGFNWTAGCTTRSAASRPSRVRSGRSAGRR
jgi:hypothetical protein